MKFYLFAKCYQSSTPEELAEKTAALGFDGPTALVRDGFTMTAENVGETLPGYIRTMNARGLEVKYADAPVNPLRDNADKLVGILAENGIENIRLDHVGKGAAKPRELFDYVRRYAELAEGLGKKHGTRCIIQIHGACYPHNATTAYMCVKDLDPRYIGVKIDPGNNIYEGHELFEYQTGLLGEYIAALGAKDGGYFRGAEGKWGLGFVPAYEGYHDYDKLMKLLYDIGFTGPAVLMPFYNMDNEALLTEKLGPELEYFKACAKNAGF